MPDTPLRGRRGRDRRIAERVATDFAARHAPTSADDEVDFDVAAVDAEVEDARRAPPKPRPIAKAGNAAAKDRGADARRRQARRPSPPGPLRPPAAPGGDRHVRGPPRAPGTAPRTTPAGPGATSGWSRSRTARRPTSPRPSPRPAMASASSGSPATRRSPIASPRNSVPGWATRRPSPSSSRGPRWPTNAAS